jgi:GAG-pre-integrase domain
LPLETSPAYTINHLTRDQLRILWHQQLGHLHNRRMKLVAKAAVGVPKIASDDDLNKCPICMAAKLCKANKGTEDSRHATICNQGISIDAGFIVQSSKDSERMRRYTGLNGETCYFTIVDHKSSTIYGETFTNKAPPIEFINRWLAQHGLGHDVPMSVWTLVVNLDLAQKLSNCSRKVVTR